MAFSGLSGTVPRKLDCNPDKLCSW